MTNIFCGKCGFKQELNAKFCPNCGTMLSFSYDVLSNENDPTKILHIVSILMLICNPILLGITWFGSLLFGNPILDKMGYFIGGLVGILCLPGLLLVTYIVAGIQGIISRKCPDISTHCFYLGIALLILNFIYTLLFSISTGWKGGSTMIFFVLNSFIPTCYTVTASNVMPLQEHRYIKEIRIFLLVGFTIVLSIATFIIGYHTERLDYYGEYPELYTVTIHSVPTVQGYFFDGSHGPFDSLILILDVDDYGRVLYIYDESKQYTVLGIVQYWDDVYVYFFPADAGNFTVFHKSKFQQDGFYIGRNIDIITDYFADEIEKLKLNNDWNKELSLDNMEMAKISRGKRWSAR